MADVLLCTVSDIILLINILLFSELFYQQTAVPSKLKTIISFSVFTVLSLVFFGLYFHIENSYNIISFVFFYIKFPVITKILTRISFKKCFFAFFATMLFVDLIHSMINNILAIALNISNSVLSSSIQIVLRLGMLLCFLLLKKRNSVKIKTVLRLLPVKVYVITLLNTASLVFMLQALNYKTDQKNVYNVLISAFPIVIVGLSIAMAAALISNCISKIYYNNINSILEKQIENQISHYKQTEQLNNDLRRFKHDYTNHMLCLKAMIGDNQSEDAVAYIEKINDEISRSSSSYNTGHKIADAILNEKSGAENDIKIKFDGHIPDFLDNVDLCIILGNAIDNAIEACRKIQSCEKTISISADIQHGHAILIITNPVSQETIISGTLPETTKSDPLNHGFGLYNIRRIVEKYEGDMNINAADGVFTLYVALKIKMPDNSVTV